ncbi:hypothetical protein D1007_35358 [Hordeum vulgare]|nr:hypothetical protein D1007_35358 [Hordeum vulgare]
MPPIAVKPAPQEMPLHQRSRDSNLVINEGRRHPSPPGSHMRMVKPKESTVIVVVKQEHEAMAADLNADLKWSRYDYVREEMEHERRTQEEIPERRHGCDEGDAIVLSDSDEEAPMPT